jgi:phosphatidylglycerol:prolipoprotein diacylglycerol transferase
VLPEIDIGPITVQTFGLCFGLGFVVAGAVIARRLVEWRKPADWAYEIAFAAFLGGLVGARIDFMIQNWDSVQGDLFGSFFGGTGLVWLGGVIGGALGAFLWARWRGMPSMRLLDLTAPSLAIGYAIGRVGCQLSGDGDYGRAWDGPWAMAYPDGTVATDVPVHPTPIYETLTMGLIAYVLWRLRDRYRAGILFALYLVLAGAERFLVEFIRRNDDALLGLTQAQVLSVGMMLAGGIWIVRIARRGQLYRDAGEAKPSPQT